LCPYILGISKAFSRSFSKTRELRIDHDRRTVITSCDPQNSKEVVVVVVLSCESYNLDSGIIDAPHDDQDS